MAEIKFTLPTVQYGNVKITATPEELGMDISDAGSVGHGAAVYLNLFTQGFASGSKADVEWSPQASSEAPQSYWEATQEQHAQELLNEGLGGVTEVSAEYNDDGPGDVQAAANEARGAAPWEQAPYPTTKKPWETSSEDW